jgi:hypothetical protein
MCVYRDLSRFSSDLLRPVESPVPKCEGPGAPSSVVYKAEGRGPPADVPYQSLLKGFLAERLKQARRLCRAR